MLHYDPLPPPQKTAQDLMNKLGKLDSGNMKWVNFLSYIIYLVQWILYLLSNWRLFCWLTVNYWFHRRFKNQWLSIRIVGTRNWWIIWALVSHKDINKLSDLLIYVAVVLVKLLIILMVTANLIEYSLATNLCLCIRCSTPVIIVERQWYGIILDSPAWPSAYFKNRNL